MIWVVTALGVLALAPAGLRWLRVAQREHYLAGSVSRFALRWWSIRPDNLALSALGVAGVVVSAWVPLAGLATVATVALGPLGLGVRGRTSQVAATRRLRALAALWLVLQGLVVVVGSLLGFPAVAALAGALVAPVLVDLALALAAPHERRLAGRFVDAASARLRQVHPTVVAVTGSYGKTSTKNHIAHLLAGTHRVVATPASFNNRAGLARAINEHLVEGTEVFVAEMGTYGPGEIAELCRWCPPDISVMTAIGPVHLERFGSEDRIVEAKSEILAGADTAVLNVDEPRLAALAQRMGATVPAGAARGPGDGQMAPAGDPAVPRRVVTVGAGGTPAQVVVRRCAESVQLEVDGEPVDPPVGVGPGLQPSNLACAAAVALSLGVPQEVVADRLGSIPSVANRLSVGTAPSGVVVLDDTYNANPAGARAALEALRGVECTGRRVLVTPGMVELGHRQSAENQALGEVASQVATDLVVVGRTNRQALVRGWRAGGSPRRLKVVDHREQAVAWVRQHLGPSDAVLYENDLPDHYP